MKNTLLALLIAILLIALACKKDALITATGEKHKVSFTTRTFTQSQEDFKTTSARTSDENLTSYFNKLYIRIYKLNPDNATEGNLVVLEDQYASDEDFGSFSASLEDGDYVAIIVGSDHQFYRLDGLGSGYYPESNYAYEHLNTAASVFSSGIPLSDIFYKKISFNVSGAALNFPVQLTRLVGGLEVEIEDAIPSYIAYIEVEIDDAVMYNFASDTRLGNIKKISTISPSSGNSLNTFVLADDTRTVTLTAYDYNEHPQFIKSASCLFKPKQKVILKGKLFDEPPLFMNKPRKWDNESVYLPL